MNRLWSEQDLLEKFGADGSAWFQEKAHRFISKCLLCSGAGEYRTRDAMVEEAWLRHKTLDGQPDPVVKEVWVVKRCDPCASYVWLLEEFYRRYLLSVPPAYRFATLRNLKPFAGTASLVSLEKQQMILDLLLADPEKGYCFCGPAHCGKTVWQTALYAENLWLYHMRDREGAPKIPVRRIKTKDLLDQHTDYAMRRYEKDAEGFSVVNEPDVTAAKIKMLSEKKWKYKLYLEEIDKIKETDSRRANLFEILDTLMEHQGVLVVNTNLRPEEMRTTFGEDFAWRIEKLCRVIDLFGDK